VATGAKNRTRNISSLRLLVQIGFVFILFFGVFQDHQNLPWPAEQINPHEALIAPNALGIPMPDGLSVPTFACYYPCGKTVTCPLWQIQAYIYPFWNAGQGWGVNYLASGAARLAVVFGLVILLSVLLGRWWCGWVCPFGLYVDVVSRVRKGLRIKHRLFSDGFNEKFHQLSYVILAVLIVVSVIFGAEALVGAQLVPGTEPGGFVNMYYAAPFCQFCPTQVKEVYENKGGDVTTSNCILCLRCVEMCPEEGCLKFKAAGKTVFKSRNWLGKKTSDEGAKA